KDGVAVLMNGKRSQMPMEALYQMLAGLNAADIEKIEIITVPPAGYDSDGDAGFVNIVMKRNSGTLGTGATLATGLGYGSGPQANFSLNLNHQGKKLNWFGSYSLNYLDHLAEWESYRESNNGLETVLTSNKADRAQKRTAHNYQFGVDFLISKRLIVSGLVSGYDNKIRIAAPTVAFIDYSISADTLIESSIDDIRHWKHGMGNVNLQYTFKNRQMLNANLDYLRYYNNSPSRYINSYYSGDRSFIRDEDNSISKETPINMRVVKVDHSIEIGESTILESGIKGTFSDLINKVKLETKKGNSWIENPIFSSYSSLTENIMAIYSSIKIELDTNTTINAGVRYEHTKTYLGTREEGTAVDRHFGNFFPSLFLYRSLNGNNKLQLSYGRRITRPTFTEMSSLGVFVDPYTFFSGNENLLPTFTQIFKGDYLFKTFVFSLQYSRDKDVIMRFQPRIDPETNTLIYSSDNIDRRNTLAATVSLPIQASPWWEIQNNFTANRQRIDTELHGEAYKVAREGFQLNSTHTFELPEKYAVELAGYYFSSIINGYFNWLPRWFINLGVKKEFNHGGVLRLSCNDIFDSNRVRWKTSDNSVVRLNGKLRPEGQGFVLTYIHNFGNSKVKGIRKRAVGSQEEQQRVTN
ncbi:MAG TPA: TonB-dependent receptor, partial [Cyclobacteriaceae bacterium]|nr:TonB-dependent receptor [Cyclobacteriaceae bacterium]